MARTNHRSAAGADRARSLAIRVAGTVSRRLDRPEILAAVDDAARDTLHEMIAARAVLTSVLRRDSTYVDIGTNRGQWLELVTPIAPDGRHMAFEPLPDLCEATSRAFPNVDVRGMALSDEAGTAAFVRFQRYDAFSGLRPQQGIADVHHTISVRLSRLDDEIGELAPALVKIDVEGAELPVLRGARGVMERHRPVVIFEHQLASASLYGVLPTDVVTYFDALDYRLFTLTGQGPLSADQFLALMPRTVNWLAVPR
jgi:FkbM family methyltransferase